MQARRRWHPLSYLYPSCWQEGDDTLCLSSIPHAGKEEMTPSVLPVSLMLGRRRWHPLYPSCRHPPPAWLDLTLDSSMYKLHARVFSSFLQQVLMVFYTYAVYCILMAFQYACCDSCCETLNFFYLYLCIGHQVFPRLLIHWVLFLKILAKNLNPTSTIKGQWRPWQVYMALNCIKVNNLQTFSFICWLYLVNNWV